MSSGRRCSVGSTISSARDDTIDPAGTGSRFYFGCRVNDPAPDDIQSGYRIVMASSVTNLSKDVAGSVGQRTGRIIMIDEAGEFNSPEEVIGKTDLNILTSEHGRRAYEDEQRIMRTGTPMLGIEEKGT